MCSPYSALYIAALIAVNVAGQVCSKLEDYACAKLEIRAGYELGRLAFDTLSNQSMTFHTNRFGGALVSSTQKFISAYSLLMDNFTYSALPTASTAILTICMLAPLAPAFVAILVVVLAAYVAIVFRLVPQDPAHQRRRERCAEPPLGRTLGFHHEHPRGKDRWARGVRTEHLRRSQPGRARRR